MNLADSWEEEALIFDKQSGVQFDENRLTFTGTPIQLADVIKHWVTQIK